MVNATLSLMCAQEEAAEIEDRWENLASSLAKRFSRFAELLLEAREAVLAFPHFQGPY
jgi:hypothetical protein